MSALPGEHYCKEHQGNESHYDKSNCSLCQLQQRLIDKTNAFMEHDLKQVTLIRKMENDIKEAHMRSIDTNSYDLLKALYYRYVANNPKTFE